MRSYLQIQHARYKDLMEYTVDIDPGLHDAMLPKLTLQPLVENAVEHGIERKEGKCGDIFIWVEENKDGDVLLRVANSGNGVTTEKTEEMNRYLETNEADFGYGVRNVNRRIELLFGQEYGLHYDVNAYQGVTVTVHLPGIPSRE